jgi:hypothetical protein
LPLLELVDGDAAPPIGRPDHRGVDQLEHRPLAEGMRHNLGPTPLLEEQALEQIRIRYESSGATRLRHRCRDALWCDHPGPGHLGARRLGRPVTYHEP